MRYLQLILRLIVAAVFFYAAINKIPNPAALVEDIRNFKLVPYWALNAMAIVLPWLELVGAVLLVGGVWLREMIGLLAGLSATYEAAGISALARGLDIKCGCFGEDYQGSAWSVIGINAALLIILLVVVWCTAGLRRSARIQDVQ